MLDALLYEVVRCKIQRFMGISCFQGFSETLQIESREILHKSGKFHLMVVDITELASLETPETLQHLGRKMALVFTNRLYGNIFHPSLLCYSGLCKRPEYANTGCIICKNIFCVFSQSIKHLLNVLTCLVFS